MHYKRKKPRTKSDSFKSWAIGSRHGEAPGHWNILFHSRPKRRRNKSNCHKVLQGEDWDHIVWDLGNRRPHIYYW